VNPPLPAVVEVGEIEVKAGTGLKIVNVCELEVPPEVVTVTKAVPARAMSEARIAAVTCVGET